MVLFVFLSGVICISEWCYSVAEVEPSVSVTTSEQLFTPSRVRFIFSTVMKVGQKVPQKKANFDDADAELTLSGALIGNF